MLADARSAIDTTSCLSLSRGRNVNGNGSARFQHGGGGFVHQPPKPSKRRPDQLRWQLRRFIGSFQNGFQNWGLVLPAHHEHHASAIVKDGSRHGNPVSEELSHPVGGDKTIVFIEGLGSRKERGCMSIWPHAEHDQIKSRKLSGRKMEEIAQHLVVFGGSLIRLLVFTLHAEYSVWANGHLRKHAIIGGPIVAVRMVGRNAAFVAEKEIDFLPGNSRIQIAVGRKQGVERLRSGTPRQSYRERTLLLDRLIRQGNESISYSSRERRCIGYDL